MRLFLGLLLLLLLSSTCEARGGMAMAVLGCYDLSLVRGVVAIARSEGIFSSNNRAARLSNGPHAPCWVVSLPDLYKRKTKTRRIRFTLVGLHWSVQCSLSDQCDYAIVKVVEKRKGKRKPRTYYILVERLSEPGWVI
jgi:hypothetical protein